MYPTPTVLLKYLLCLSDKVTSLLFYQARRGHRWAFSYLGEYCHWSCSVPQTSRPTQASPWLSSQVRTSWEPHLKPLIGKQYSRTSRVSANYNDRYTKLELVGIGISGLVWYDTRRSAPFQIAYESLYCSSAKDKLANQTVAIKKLCDPFKTESVAKHMFREVRLLKQLRHENVCRLSCYLTS